MIQLCMAFSFALCEHLSRSREASMCMRDFYIKMTLRLCLDGSCFPPDSASVSNMRRPPIVSRKQTILYVYICTARIAPDDVLDEITIVYAFIGFMSRARRHNSSRS